LNGAVFNHLPKLERVKLEGNLCINRNYERQEIEIVVDEVSKQCGTISEQLLENFISGWKNEAIRNQKLLNSCINRKDVQLKDEMITKVK
jgi:hypothetical protein